MSGPIDAAVDRVLLAKRQQEFADLVRLAEQVFPAEWNVRVDGQPGPGGGFFVQVRYVVAYGTDPLDALQKAIDWYRNQKQSRIVLPGRS